MFHLFFLSDSYSKENILCFVNKIIDKTRFMPLKQINWENKFVVKGNNAYFENIDRDFENQYGMLIDKLLNKLKEYGFATLDFSYNYATNLTSNVQNLSLNAKESEKIKRELFKKMIELDQSSTSYESNSNSPLRIKKES
nr:hypothetical protein [Mycoplasmopsis bovis]